MGFRMTTEGTPHRGKKGPRPHIAAEFRDNGQSDLAEEMSSKLLPHLRGIAEGRPSPEVQAKLRAQVAARQAKARGIANA